jgi:hypothetical protein
VGSQPHAVRPGPDTRETLACCARSVRHQQLNTLSGDKTESLDEYESNIDTADATHDLKENI